MRPPRRPRGLTGEDAFLWGEIARLITPLRGRARAGKPKAASAAGAVPAKPAPAKPAPAKPVPAKPAVAFEPDARSPARKPAPMAPPLSAAPKAAPKPPGKRILKPVPAPVAPAPTIVAPAPVLPGLERKARLALRRGSLKVEARIDLHGMYQAQAHDALIGFLMRCRASGHAHVLVVTGKGGAGYDDAFSERGVLRRSVPHWLRAPDLRSVVLGFEEAARHHGGAGALYVRLRRR